MRSIKGYKMRALLTMLGISFGIFTITFVFTLVNTMQVSLSKNLSSLGNTVIFVHHWPWKDNSEDWYKYFNRRKMRYADYQRLQQHLNDVDALYFAAEIHGVSVQHRGQSVQGASLSGVTRDYLYISGNTLVQGRDFSRLEMQSGRKVCILGYNVAGQLFGGQPAVGQKVRMKGGELLVIGVMAKAGVTLFGSSADEDILIPYPLMTRIYNINERAVDKVIAVKATDYRHMAALESQLIGQMRISRGLRPDVEDDFAINKQESLMQNLNALFGYLNTGGIFISLLSLLVGGFGIANIMFVSVKERTKEIGIQKSLGATRSFILRQFLLESVALCVLGGLLGFVLLFALAGLAQLALNALDLGMTVVIAPGDLLLGLVLSICIGVVSGLLPSLVAARMDPVVAMRQG
ncbi:MAG: ABC transporter permease [Bacteroidetes bacterium]|nr:ABC transporter permease [Bacteroidota bacterium]